MTEGKSCKGLGIRSVEDGKQPCDTEDPRIVGVFFEDMSSVNHLHARCRKVGKPLSAILEGPGEH